jgi:hypothetical protein
MCQVSRHPWPDDVACLICLFRKPEEGKSAEQVQHEVTGLAANILAQPDALLEEKHLTRSQLKKKSHKPKQKLQIQFNIVSFKEFKNLAGLLNTKASLMTTLTKPPT